MINWMIKRLGGYTKQEFNKAERDSKRTPLLLSSPQAKKWLSQINRRDLKIHTCNDNPDRLRGLEPSTVIIDAPIQWELMDMITQRCLHVVDLRSPQQRN